MSDVKVDPGPGYRLLEDGEEIPNDYEYSYCVGEWVRGEVEGRRAAGENWNRSDFVPMRVKLPEATKESPSWRDKLDAKLNETPDPKTKYIRDIYPVDSEVHTDANGKQFVRIDVYSVLRAFGVDHPTGHAVKKLLCAGLRGKGDRIQDLTEAKVAIDRAIQEAGIG